MNKLTPREPTPEMVEAERVKFAAWIVTQGWIEAPTARENGSYVNGALQARWLGWKARAMHDAAPSGWQPIETAPKDGRTVIVGRDMGDFGFVRGTGRFEGKPGSFLSGWVCRGFTDPPGELGLAHPTHWMPLPAPPSEQAAPSVPSVEQELLDEINRLRTALRFYARSEHFTLDESEEFDTVSGEPQNWLCSGREDSATMVENGQVARFALQGIDANWIDGDEDNTPQPIDGEVTCAAIARAKGE